MASKKSDQTLAAEVVEQAKGEKIDQQHLIAIASFHGRRGKSPEEIKTLMSRFT